VAQALACAVSSPRNSPRARKAAAQTGVCATVPLALPGALPIPDHAAANGRVTQVVSGLSSRSRLPTSHLATTASQRSPGSPAMWKYMRSQERVQFFQEFQARCPRQSSQIVQKKSARVSRCPVWYSLRCRRLLSCDDFGLRAKGGSGSGDTVAGGGRDGRDRETITSWFCWTAGTIYCRACSLWPS
jgi:hypothetical protein